MKNRYFKGGIILLFSLLLVAAGIIRGEMIVIFTKAVNICLECIGLG